MVVSTVGDVIRLGKSDVYIPLASIERGAKRILLSRRPDLVDDAVQNACIKIITYRKPSPQISNPRAYGVTVGKAAAIDLLKKDLEQRGSGFVLVLDDSATDSTSYSYSAKFVLEHWAAQIRTRVAQVLKAVGLEIWDCLAEGMNPTEIASELRISRVTVYKYRNLIREIIAAFEPDPPDGSDGGGGNHDPPTYLKPGAAKAVVAKQERRFKEDMKNATRNRIQAPREGVARSDGDLDRLFTDFKAMLLDLPGFRAPTDPGSAERPDSLRAILRELSSARSRR